MDEKRRLCPGRDDKERRRRRAAPTTTMGRRRRDEEESEEEMDDDDDDLEVGGSGSELDDEDDERDDGMENDGGGSAEEDDDDELEAEMAALEAIKRERAAKNAAGKGLKTFVNNAAGLEASLEGTWCGLGDATRARAKREERRLERLDGFVCMVSFWSGRLTTVLFCFVVYRFPMDAQGALDRSHDHHGFEYRSRGGCERRLDARNLLLRARARVGE